jgi:hypothetical protein
VPEELLPLLVSPEWVDERKKRWGVTSPIYTSKVLGEFPDISDDTLIMLKWIEAAQARTIKRNGRPVLAWDIARFGEDETVGMRREGGWMRVCRAHSKADTMTTTGHIAKAHRDINGERGLKDWPTHVVDVVGVGAGVYDRLVELGVPVTPYNGGEAPFDKERFINARAEDYWNLREMFEAGEVDIDELDDVLAAQLGSIKWTVDSRGRIKIESKDDMRKRGLPSPDRGCRSDGDVSTRNWWSEGRRRVSPRPQHHRRLDGEGLVRGGCREDTPAVDRLDQLFARSQREIESHTGELDDAETGRYFIDEAAQLLAALRLWAQAQHRSDQVVRDILETGDVVALKDVARELWELGTKDSKVASWSVQAMAKRPSGQLAAISSYALRAL